jgi:hypothetical protein
LPTWSEEHANAVAEEQADDGLQKYGPVTKGYHWQNVYLPNGTQLKIHYKSRDHFAEIRHQQLYYEGTPSSPSQFVSRVANNTSRNAWRDIWIKRPEDKDWVFADQLRVGAERKKASEVLAEIIERTGEPGFKRRI